MTDVANDGNWQAATISIVGSATKTDTHDITVAEALDGIRDGRWKKCVSRVRDKYSGAYRQAVEDGNPEPAKVAKKATDWLKKKLPALIFSGRFSKRSEDGLLVHSGLICIDIDLCDVATVRDRLKADPYVAATFVSPTGSGLKALIRTRADVALHERSFLAARRHFKDAHSLDVDNCKDLSGLCFVSHDPEIFVRNGNAEILEPERASRPDPAQRDGKEETGDNKTAKDLMFLPYSGKVTNSQSADLIFGKISRSEPPNMFVRGGSVVTISKSTTPQGENLLAIEDVSPSVFRSEAERYGTLLGYRTGPHGEPHLKLNALMSEDIAKVLLSSRERLQLPPLSLIHRCPLLVEQDGKPVILRHGYHRDFGGCYIGSNGEISLMNMEEAVSTILELIDEFHFATESDKARAVAGIITPTMRFGGLLQCHFPALLVESDHSQAGKGTLVEMIQRLYGELAGMTAKRKGGVGSFDEDLSRQLLQGRPFIQIDNIRDSLTSEFFEECMTCPLGGVVPARVPYRRAVDVDPNRHIFHLTSNKFESTRDLANRSCVIRILKREGYRWKKFAGGRMLLAHIVANPWRYLSAIYSVAGQWVARGKPRNEDEIRGEGRFREWWQVSDWIAQDVFGLPPVLDGHEKIQRRVASAAQSWARNMGNHLKAEEMLGMEFSASRLVEIASEADEAAGLDIPGTPPDASDEQKNKRLGALMASLFKDGSTAEVDMFQITRIGREEERPGHYDLRVRKFYIFRLIDDFPGV